LIVHPGHATSLRGLLVGILGSVLAHPLIFTMAGLYPAGELSLA
jgi:hypothetical protein